MTFSYFITVANRLDPAARLSAGHRERIAEIIRATHGLLRAELHIPADIATYHDDGAAPLLELRLEFSCVETFEAQVSSGGHIWQLSRSDDWISMGASHVTHQAMLTRTFLPLPGMDGDSTLCSYLVHYPGSSEDLNAWLTYYLAHHPQIMLDYPDVLQVNVFTRIDWCDSMPWTRVNYMQRNMLTFASPEILLEALTSPVRARMREDNARFPMFSGAALHHAMSTILIAPTTGTLFSRRCDPLELLNHHQNQENSYDLDKFI